MIDLLTSPEVIGAVVGALLGVVLGALVTSRRQRRSDEQRRPQLTYYAEAEVALRLAKEELKEKLRITYEGTEIDKLFFFNLRIRNTSRRTIRNQAFTCLFSKSAKSIDPAFPHVSTDPIREVGPIIEDKSVNNNYEFRYIIEVLGPGQVVSIDFLTIENETSDFDVIFRPNNETEVEFIEGYVFKRRDLTSSEDRVLEMLIAGFTISEIAMEMSLSRSTVRRIVQRIYQKQGVKTRAELGAKNRM